MKFAGYYRHLSIVLTVASLLLLSSCGSPYRAPVNELGGAQRFLDAGRTHRVNAGETLYAIAWMYDLDFNVLAKANNLPQPYDLAEGQLLVIDLRNTAGAAPVRNNNNVAAANGVTVNPAQVSGGISRTQLPGSTLQRTPLPDSSAAAANTPLPVDTRPAERTAPGPVASTAARTPTATGERTATAAERTPTIQPAPTVVARVETPAPAVAGKQSGSDAPLVWGWPSRGTVIGRFSDASVDKKGLDIGGNRGDAVLAAADGEIVYTGSGVLLYGDLVIIKHNDHFLSAYAHNDRILVKERTMVKRGDTIAELGSSGIDRNMLHFEIRMDGTPVDPLLYLPAK